MRENIEKVLKMTNVVAKINITEKIMLESIESMDSSFGFFDNEAIGYVETEMAIKTNNRIVSRYVVEKIVDFSYDADIIQREGLEYDEVMAIAKFLIEKEGE